MEKPQREGSLGRQRSLRKVGGGGGVVKGEGRGERGTGEGVRGRGASEGGREGGRHGEPGGGGRAGKGNTYFPFTNCRVRSTQMSSQIHGINDGFPVEWLDFVLSVSIEPGNHGVPVLLTCPLYCLQ
eukprot:jgi/Botrbrau1/10592/Bobra.0358s0012.1